MDNPNYIPLYVFGCCLALFVLLATKFRPLPRQLLAVGLMVLPVLIVYAWERIT